MVAASCLLLMSWAGIATTALVAPKLRSATAIAVGLGMSYAVTLGASTVVLLFWGPSALSALPYVLGGTAFAVSVGLVRRRQGPSGLQSDEPAWPSWVVLCVAFLVSLQANLVRSPGYNENTLFYLTFGSFVAGPNAPYPALWAYGNEYVLPFMQLKYALVFPTMLWSTGDPIAFLHRGVPALSVLITASVSFVAYEFFRLHARPTPAALFAVIWLTGCVEHKLYSVRAEPIGWIPAFSFLIALTWALRERSARGLWFLCAALLVTTSLLHGIVFLVSACMGACIWLAAVYRAGPARRMILCRSAAITAVIAALLLSVVYYGVHARHTRGVSKAFVEMEGSRPATGSVDPTRRFFDLYSNKELVDTKGRINEAPPAVSLSQNVSIALTQPLLRPFRLRSESQNRVILGLGILAATLLLVRGHRSRAWSGLTLGFAATIVFLFGLSVVLNYRSYGWFPWAVVERRFLRYISTSEAMILASLVVAAAYAWACRPWERWTVRIGILVASALVLASVPDWSIARERSWYLKPEFAEMTRYLRTHARPGDRAVSSWGSMGHMRYLTGIPHDSEGVMPYEVYRLISQNAVSLERTREFLDQPNREYLDDTGVRYVVVTWLRRQPRATFSHAPVQEFEELGELVFMNNGYAVLDMKGPLASPKRP